MQQSQFHFFSPLELIFIFHFYYREVALKWLRDQYLEKYHNYKNYSEETTPTLDAFSKTSGGKTNADDMLRFIW